MELTFSKALLQKAADCDSLLEKPAIKKAENGDATALSMYMAQITFRKFLTAYRLRSSLWVCLRRIAGLKPDRNDALTASWEVLSNTSFTFEPTNG